MFLWAALSSFAKATENRGGPWPTRAENKGRQNSIGLGQSRAADPLADPGNGQAQDLALEMGGDFSSKCNLVQFAILLGCEPPTMVWKRNIHNKLSFPRNRESSLYYF